MKLLTKALLKRLPALGSQLGASDPMLWVKFFTPDGGWTWFAAEGSRDEQSNRFIFWGYAVGLDAEWGTFTLSDLLSVRGPLGLPVERDLWFQPQPFSQLKR